MTTRDSSTAPSAEDVAAMEIGRAMIAAQRTASSIIAEARRQAGTPVYDGSAELGGDVAADVSPLPRGGAQSETVAKLAGEVEAIEQAMLDGQDRLRKALDRASKASSSDASDLGGCDQPVDGRSASQ